MTINIDALIERLIQPLKNKSMREVLLKENEIIYLIETSKDIFMGQSVLIEVSPPLRVCGDIHGQYSDLLELFDYTGFPPERYLFLGDYVDRGKQSLETICLLLAYKIKYPNDFFLLRGNHETSAVNRIYGFYDECKRRFSTKLWRKFAEVFNVMPICALIENRILCMHGGISPDLSNFEQIRALKRPLEIPEKGLLCDLLWSDPENTTGWGENERGVSVTFGSDVVDDFLEKHELDLICRAHQVVEEGYQFFADQGLVTIFSAPNYCNEYDNSGAVMVIDSNLICSFMVLRPLFRGDRKKDGRIKRPISTPPRK